MAVIQEKDVPKKTFSLGKLLSLILGTVASILFSEYPVSLFHQSNCYHPFLNGYCIYFTQELEAIHCVYTMYLADIFVLDVLLFQRNTCSHTFWRTPLLFQEAFFRGSVLLWSEQLQSSFQSYWINFSRPVTTIHSLNDSFSYQISGVWAMKFPKCTVFFSENQLQQGDVIVTNFGASVVVSMYLLKDSL